VSPLQAAVLGLIQGITEFIPVSSSAHLILTSYLLGWEDQGLAFDMAVHAGSLIALILYLRRDLFGILGSFLPGAGDGSSGERRLGLQLVAATVPVAVLGLLSRDLVEAHLRDPRVVAVALIVFGTLLWVADRFGRGDLGIDSLSWPTVMLIGTAQVLAMIPGTSRSGVTMTAALAIGLARTEAARFSFLLAVPVLGLVAAKTVLDLASGTAMAPPAAALATGFVASAIAAYLAVAWLLRWLRTRSMTPFVLYRVILGLVILAL
jgi:undecaprenyl-diphosphatase